MSLPQSQIDALEHLLMSALKSQGLSMHAYKIFDNAHASIMSENGPPGTTGKTEAITYLEHLKLQLKP